MCKCTTLFLCVYVCVVSDKREYERLKGKRKGPSHKSLISYILRYQIFIKGQDWFHNLWGPVQNEKMGHLVKKF